MSVDALLDELRRLRKGDGATVPKLGDSLAITTLRQVRQQTMRERPDELALAAYRVLRSTVLNLGSDPKVLMAGRALGIGLDIRGNLTFRRSLSVADGYSLTTVRDWEDQGMHVLAFALFETHKEKLGSDGQDGPDPSAEFDLDSVSVHYRFGEGRLPIDWVDRRTLRSRVEGLRDLLVKHLYTGEAKVDVQVVAGGKIDGQFEAADSVTGFRTQRVILDKVLAPNDSHDLVVVKKLLGHATPPQPFLLFVPEQPTAHCQVTVDFQDELPLEGPWRTRCFAHSMPQAIGSVRPAQISNGRSSVEFVDLQLGYGYGLTWRWDPDGLKDSW